MPLYVNRYSPHARTPIIGCGNSENGVNQPFLTKLSQAQGTLTLRPLRGNGATKGVEPFQRQANFVVLNQSTIGQFVADAALGEAAAKALIRREPKDDHEFQRQSQLRISTTISSDARLFGGPFWHNS
jgi:hypothetical protein